MELEKSGLSLNLKMTVSENELLFPLFKMLRDSYQQVRNENNDEELIYFLREGSKNIEGKKVENDQEVLRNFTDMLTMLDKIVKLHSDETIEVENIFEEIKESPQVNIPQFNIDFEVNNFKESSDYKELTKEEVATLKDNLLRHLMEHRDLNYKKFIGCCNWILYGVKYADENKIVIYESNNFNRTELQYKITPNENY